MRCGLVHGGWTKNYNAAVRFKDQASANAIAKVISHQAQADMMYVGLDLAGEDAPKKPTIIIDFDGVIHSYRSGWKAIDVMPDNPVRGAIDFLWRASEHFHVAVFSTRSSEARGRSAMRRYIRDHAMDHFEDVSQAHELVKRLQFPARKLPALVTIDDRAIPFLGQFPSIDYIKAFRPWNKP